MASPSALSALWSVSLLTVLLTAAVHSNIVDDDDPLQPVTSDETVSVGGTVTLTCRVEESDNSSLQWSNTAQQTLYFGEKRALRDNRIQLHRSTSTELSITIAEVQMSDEGEYTCSIFTMPVRTARATVTVLGVPGKPQISGFETPVQEGHKVTLTCTSTGSKPPAKLHWYRGDEKLEGHLDAFEPVPDDSTYNVSSRLTLEVTSSDDNALITCAVDHPSLAPGNKRSEQILRVLYPPNVQIKADSSLPREGEKFSLRCLGTGNPVPTTYIWERKDGELPSLAKANGAVLDFPMLNKSDNGVYICHADNGIGNNQGEYTLQVQDPRDPDSPDPTVPTLDSTTSSAFPPSPTTPSPLPDVTGSGTDSAPFSTSTPPDLISTSSPPDATSSPPDATSTPPDLISTSSPPDATSSPSDFISTSTASPPDPISTSSSPPDLISASSSPPDLISTSSSSPITADESHAVSSSSSSTTALSNVLFPDMPVSPDSPSSSPTLSPSSSSINPSSTTPSSLASSLTPSDSVRLNGVYTVPEPTARSTSSGVDHAVIGGVVAVIVFILLCLLIVLGRYLIRHKGTYLTHEAKGSDDAPDADTAIINAEGGHSGAEDKKEYFI